MKKASGHLQLCAYYWAVVIGNPQPDSAFQKVGLTLKNDPTVDNDKQVCINLSQVFNDLPGELCLLWYKLLWVSCLLIPEITFMPVNTNVCGGVIHCSVLNLII
jgi:hypothetical protein